MRGSRRERGIAAVAVLAVLLGVALRLAWPSDIEYKGDERWTFEQVQLFLAGGPWRWTGQPTSMVTPHPGMSLWVFILLGRLFAARTPPDLAQGVQILNVLALLGFIAFARFAVPEGERRTWCWGAAFWAVNPIAIILERKVWPPSVMPAFVVAFLAAWWYRARFFPAFLWGALGAMLGLTYTAAWFLTLAVLVWTLIYDRRSVHWPAWLLGNVVAGWPVIPWAAEILSRSGPSAFHWRFVPLLHYYVRWATQPFGLGIDYTLGWTEMLRFLAGPLVAGSPTYLMGAFYLTAAILFVTAASLTAAKLARFGLPTAPEIFLGKDPTGVFVRAVVWGYGGILTLMTFTGLDSHRHYLIPVAPMMALWAVRLLEWSAESRRMLNVMLVAAVVSQAAVSCGLIGYIHVTQVIGGDAGPTWKAQQP